MRSYEELLQAQQTADNGYLVIVLASLAIVLLILLFRQYLAPYFSDMKAPVISIKSALIIGFIVRIPGLFESFWYDETFTANIATLPIMRAISVILADVHPPGAYLPYWIIGQFSDSEIMLRLPSLIAGMAIIYMVYLIAKKWGAEVAGYAALFTALSPALVWYAGEARAYSILVAIALSAVYAMLYKKDRQFYISLALLPLLHSYGYLHAFVIGIVWLYQKRTMQAFFKLALSALPSLLWFPFMLGQSTDVSNGFWIMPPTIGTGIRIFSDNLIGTAYPPLVAMIAIPTITICIMLALWHNRTEYRLFILLLSVPVIAFVVSHLWSPIYLYRALLPSTIIIVFLLAKWSVKAPRMTWLLIATLIMVLIVKSHPSAQRARMNDFIASCGDSPIYAPTLEAGIIANYYSDNTVYLYTEPNNLNQSLPVHARNALGFQHRAIAPANACIYWQDTPMTDDRQRDNLALSLATRASYEQIELFATDNIIVEVYR